MFIVGHATWCCLESGRNHLLEFVGVVLGTPRITVKTIWNILVALYNCYIFLEKLLTKRHRGQFNS